MAEVAVTVEPLAAPAPIDNRHRWLSETISKLLGISDRKFADDLLIDNSEQIRCFFDDAIEKIADSNKRVLFTWRTFYDKLVEETISVLEEVAPATPPPEVVKKKTKGKGKKTKDVDIDDGSRPNSAAGFSDEEIEGKKGKGKGKKKKKVSSRPQSPVYIEVQKIIQSYVKTPILHCHFGPLLPDNTSANVKYVYFLRKHPAKIASYDDYAECAMEMLNLFIIGSTDGRMTASMHRMMTCIYPKVFDTQCRHVVVTNYNLFAAADSDPIEQLKVSRPSDFRPRRSMPTQMNVSDAEQRRQKSAIRALFREIVDPFTEAIERLVSSAHIELDLTGANIPPDENENPAEEDGQSSRNATPIVETSGRLMKTAQLEELAREWMRPMQKLLLVYKTKEPIDDSPISEFQLWQTQETEFKDMLESMKQPSVVAVQQKLDESGSAVGREFQALIETVDEKYRTASEITQYLSTIVDYLNKIRDDSNFDSITALMPNLMLGLRHIWTMSKHFCQDGHMETLLYKISFVFTEKVKRIVTPRQIFKCPPIDAYGLAMRCAKLLLTWKTSYLETRASIEKAEVGSRWEFNKSHLFDDIDHYSRISNDIANVSLVFIEFDNLFEKQLKGMIFNPDDVNDILDKIYKLIDYIVNIDYDIFRPANLENWEASLKMFNQKLATIEEDAKLVIDQSIESLRSTEMGVKLIRNINNISTRRCLIDHIHTKYHGIVAKFISELDTVEREFQRNKTKPPLPKNQPNFIGAVLWKRLLFEYVERSANAFREIENDPRAATGKINLTAIAMEKYRAIIKDLNDFERLKCDQFVAIGTKTVNGALKSNILKLEYANDSSVTAIAFGIQSRNRKSKKGIKQKDGPGQAAAKRTAADERKIKFIHVALAMRWLVQAVKHENVADQHQLSAQQIKLLTSAAKPDNAQTWETLIGHSILIEFQLKFRVNFPYELYDIIMEGHQFECNGLELNPVIRMAIMRKETLFVDVNSIAQMVNDYNEIMDHLTKPEMYFLRDIIRSIELKVQAGLSRHSWQSMNIDEYCQRCRTLMNGLQLSIMQMEDVSADIESHIDQIEAIVMLKFNGENLSRESAVDASSLPKNVAFVDDFGLPSMEKYFANIYARKKSQRKRVNNLIASIGADLMKLESSILATRTGRSPHMQLYYSFWEDKLLKSLIGMTQSNLQKFLTILRDDSTAFSVDAALSTPEIISRPTPVQIYNIIMQTVNDFLEGLKLSARWVPGTCLAADTDEETEDLQPTAVVPFYDDIIGVRSVCDTVEDIQKRAREIVSSMRSYLFGWNKYKMLWASDKTTVCMKFVSRGLPLVRIDEKFLFYTNIVERMDASKRHHDVGPIRVNLNALINSVRTHAIEWKNTLGRILIDDAKASIHYLSEHIIDLKVSLHRSVKGFDDFKSVMRTIATIQSSTISTELRIRQMQEMFNIFKDHQIKFGYSDMFMSYVLEKKWHQLFNSSLLRIEELQPMKQQFAELTTNEITNFKSKLSVFVDRFVTEGPGAKGVDMDASIKLIPYYSDQFKFFEQQRQEFVNAEKLFDMEFTDYASFLHAKKELDGTIQILRLYEKQKIAVSSWATTIWTNLKPNLLLEAIDVIIQKFCRLDEWMQQLHVGQILYTDMSQFKAAVPFMAKLKNDALRSRHWQLLMEKTGHTFDMESGRFEVAHMFAMALYKHQTVVEEIIHTATNEVLIERTMDELIAKWNEKTFTLKAHFKGDKSRSFILCDTDPIVQTLEDDAMQLQVLSMSAFIGPFYDLVHTWERNLSLVFEIIEQWMNVTQRKWLYLEGIFVDGDARQILPDVAEHFDRIDATYRYILDESAANPSVMAVCMAPNRLNVFHQLNDGLERCQKLLNEYLESKRHVFPRFYFVSKDELLSILGNGNPVSIQPHIIKMFANMKSLVLEYGADGAPCVNGVVSTEGEVLRFNASVTTNDLVENWLNNILNEMHRSCRFAIKKAIFDFGKNAHRTRNEWIDEHLGGICLAANSVWFVAVMQDTFRKMQNGNKNAMKTFLAHKNGQIDDLIAKVCSDVSNNDRLKYRMITIADVHARDTIDSFVVQHVTDAHDFLWRSQLRFHWLKETDNLHVEHCSGHIDYGYEYFGLDGRLVVTPLTHKIHLAVTHALTMQMGCTMSGPMASGKAETIRDLAKILAIFSLITNCTALTDYSSVETILSGLMQCGGWSCLTHFDSMNAVTIDVISMLLHTLRESMLLTKSRFIFGSHEFNIDRKFGAFITINPAVGKRTEISSFLKAHFRAVSCVQPDVELICAVSLFSDGFSTAKILAKKIVMLCRLASEQLTKHCHYDWGLRSLRSVLNVASQMRQQQPGLPEAVILIRSLHDVNLSKLVFEDVPLFLGIIKDLFPGIDCPQETHPTLCEAIKNVLEANSYGTLSYQQEKIIQLYKTMSMRHCTVVIGATGGGKSVIISTLIKAQQEMGLATKLITLNPKACPATELYGYLNSDTGDWVDGLFANIFRDSNRPVDGEEHRYVCLDGDMDPVWIETMNTVMDDNKLLTLANGERIRLESHCSILFEVGDLEHASPATVARVGVVFVDATELGIEPVWQRWLQQRDSSEHEWLQHLFEKYIIPCSENIVNGTIRSNNSNHLDTVIHQTHLNMLSQFCCVFDVLFPQAVIPKHAKQYSNDAIESGFVDCLYKSFGGALKAHDRVRFDALVKRHMKRSYAEDAIDRPATVVECPSDRETLFDYFFDLERNAWIAYDWIVPEYVHDSALKYSEIFVPTVDAVRINHTLSRMINAKHPIILFGETATSKTATMLNHMNHLRDEGLNTLKVVFSWRTTSLDVQHAIESAIEKRTKDTFGPPLGQRLAVFIDNLNIPKPDCYDTQQPIALLKLLFEKGGTFDRDKDLNWKYLKDVLYYGVATVPGGDRMRLDARFVSQCAVFNVMAPAERTICTIYQSILRGHLSGSFSTDLLPIAEKLIDVSHKLLMMGIERLPPTPSKFHYTFNLKDLAKICSGMLMTHSNLFELPKQLVRVWRNEFCRVVCDRLIAEQDAELMTTLISTEIRDNFAPPQSGVAPIARHDSNDSIDLAESVAENLEIDVGLSIHQYALRDPLLFGDYRNMINKNQTRYYEDLLDYEAIYFLFQEILQQYNETIGVLTLTLFEEFLEHLTRVHRVLRMNGGHALLVGCEGCGKRSTTKLAAFAADCRVFEIIQSNDFDDRQLQKELQTLFHRIGIAEVSTTLMVPINQMDEVTEHLLEIVNKIITVGVTDDLFSPADRCRIIEEWRERADSTASDRDAWNRFLEKCNENIHIVLCVTPTKTFRTVCRLSHGLVGSVYINWMPSWTEKVLIKVANTFLADHPNIPETFQESIIGHVVHVHTSVQDYSLAYWRKCNRLNYFTPKHYIEFIQNYLKLMDESKRVIIDRCNRHAEAIAKIDEVSDQFDHLSILTSDQQNDVTNLATKCQEIAQNIEKLTDTVERKSTEVIIKQNEIVSMGKLIANEKEATEEAITLALHPLKAAKLRLVELDRGELSEFVENETPPEPIEIVGECFAVLKGIRDVSWKTGRTIMAEENFPKSLADLNCDAITSKQLAQCKNLIKKIDSNELAKTSASFSELLDFVRTVVAYCDILREIKAKRELIRTQEDEMEKCINVLQALNIERNKVDAELTEMRQQHVIDQTEKNRIESLLSESTERLNASRQLADKLMSERSQWSGRLSTLENENDKVIGNSLLSAAFYTYAGGFSFSYRHQIVHDDWLQDISRRKIPIDSPFTSLNRNVPKLSIDATESFIQNAILVTNAIRYALCIDPYGIAGEFIKATHEDSGVCKILHFYDEHFMDELTSAVSAGECVIVDDIDDCIDHSLRDLLEPNSIADRRQSCVKVLNREISCHSNFRMYFLTRKSVPALAPSLYSLTTVIDFDITDDSLDMELFGAATNTLNPDLERRRKSNLRDRRSIDENVKSLEDGFLEMIASTDGPLLDNTEIIDGVEKAKTAIVSLRNALREIAENGATIDIERQKYRSLVKKAAPLFIALIEMAKVNVLYQYSLADFIELFVCALRECVESDSDVSEENSQIYSALAKRCYDFGVIGMIGFDRILFALHIAINCERSEGRLEQNQVDFFFGASTNVASATSPIEWLTDQQWSHFDAFQRKFTNIAAIQSNEPAWQRWYSSDYPESVDIPGGSFSCDDFMQLNIIKCLRMDRVNGAIRRFISLKLGADFLEPPYVHIHDIPDRSSSRQPIVVIRCDPTEPTHTIKKLSPKSQIVTCDGHTHEAIVANLKECMDTGLALIIRYRETGWNSIKQICSLLASARIHNENFRLWIIVEEKQSFPHDLLRKALKIVSERPNSLRENMRKTYAELIHSNAPNPLLYVLGFFHAVVQERIKFGKSGWNIAYEFNEHDFDGSVSILNGIVENGSAVCWTSVKYFLGEIIYGGRVLDDFDKRLLHTYLNEYFGNFLFSEFHAYDRSKRAESGCALLVMPKTFQEFFDLSNELPLENAPEILGLHENVNVLYNVGRADYIRRRLQKGYSMDAGNFIGIKPSDDFYSISVRDNDIDAIILDLLERLPKTFEIWRVKEMLQMKLSPTGVVLLQELQRYNALVDEIENNLQLLRKAMAGKISMNASHEEIAMALRKNRIPECWQKLAPNTTMHLSTWLCHLQERAQQYKLWSDSGEPTVMWLSGLHAPVSYLKAIVQTDCRKNIWPIECTTLFTHVTEYWNTNQVEDRPEMGCFVTGLSIEGAEWSIEQNSLVNSKPNVLSEALPILAILPMQRQQIQTKNNIVVPVYATACRAGCDGRGLLFEAYLRNTEHASKWILRGVCLILNADRDKSSPVQRVTPE